MQRLLQIGGENSGGLCPYLVPFRLLALIDKALEAYFVVGERWRVTSDGSDQSPMVV